MVQADISLPDSSEKVTDPHAWMDQFARDVIKRVAELPDRSSPDDWPDAMLVTENELHFIVVQTLKEYGE